MSEIALYNALTKLGLEADEAEKAVAGVANIKDVATKADIVELKTELKYMRWLIVIVVSIAVALIKYLP